ncbi:hypothetical protein M404DRAFT_19359 [Pisolithus tinctorius Marx 270]|uniref:CASTOR ACT domain-containing protein n=1 Tax=Pisolithus tinctorius Marx 270 TaxID=870435 RepID=A0A0C3KSS3_PISTI|nr:hypothetical protein M404DRAFT_19359 [Pisolithus tinctorius Marx 270]
MAQTPAPSNVTISLLPVSLSLVHIPRSRLPQLTHPILRQILQPNTTFFNVTCNEIELTLFAEHHNLADLDLIARQDRQLHRSRSGSGSSRKRALSDGDRVEITCENWNVLQIDSHSDQLDNSGARVHELSAPLAAAGISILYQSSYRSDFIFVKESRLHQVLSLLRAAGFDLYSSDAEPFPPITSPLASPPTPYEMLSHELGHEFSLESGAVLTRSVDTFVDALSASQKLNSAVEQQKQTTSPQPARSKSRSPSPTDVSILSTDLACVGLSDENMDNWALKIVKLVAFSDLIPLSSSSHLRHRGFSAYNGVVKIPSRKRPESAQIHTFSSRSRAGSHSTETTATSSSNEADDGYVSHSPIGNEPFLSSPASHSYPDLSQTIQSPSHALKRTSKCVTSPLSFSPVDPAPTRGLAPLSSKPSSPFAKQCFNTTRQPVTVPFFSFTRTSEGSSLTTDVSVLAALFPPSERHMLSCAGELEALGDSPSLPSGGDWEESEERIEGSTLKCLQIDLRRFGLGQCDRAARYIVS